MKKRLFLLVALVALSLTLTGCWPGEVAVDTTINTDGSGTRTYVLTVFDDSLQTDPITNLDDPDGTEGKGAIINSIHITGGVSEIQTWFDDNSPEWMTVEDMQTVGNQRIFTLSYDFADFDEFLSRYEQLVDLSPTTSWSDFDAIELPTFECSGLLTKECTFTETTNLVNASFDWAVDGIYEDIYDEASLAGYVTKSDISVLADYTLELNGETIEELHAYDADAADGTDNTGVVVNVTSESFTLSTSFTNTIAIVVGVAAIAVIGGGVFFFIKKK
jgi:hypothetical protein